MKYYVVADPHGFYSYMMEALKEKGFFEEKKPHKLVICGDLFDRGDEAVEMQEFVSKLIDEDRVVLIKGNHEDLVLDFIDNMGKYISYGLMATHHFSNGTIDTCCQLTGLDLFEMEQDPERLKAEMYKTIYIKKIIPKMVDYFETPNHIFVHGWIPCNKQKIKMSFSAYQKITNWRESSKEQWDKARWINGMEAADFGVIEDDKTIVCGHWHTSYGHSRIEGRCPEFGPSADFSPYYAKGIIALDACTIESRKVNCIVIED